MAKMWKNSYKVDVTTSGGYTASFDDSANTGQGSAAYASVMSGQDIHGIVEDNEIVIPFHAVDHAVITFSRTEVDKPVDDMCVVEEP